MLSQGAVSVGANNRTAHYIDAAVAGCHTACQALGVGPIAAVQGAVLRADVAHVETLFIGFC